MKLPLNATVEERLRRVYFEGDRETIALVNDMIPRQHLKDAVSLIDSMLEYEQDECTIANLDILRNLLTKEL